MKPIKVIFAMLIVVVCAAFFIATPRNAQAAPLMSSWFFEDDLESSLSPWICWSPTQGDHGCSWLSTSETRSWILAAKNPYSIDTAGRRVTISPFNSNMSCKATMFFKPFAHYQPATPPYSGQLEVIDYNSWTYNKIKTYTYIYLPTPGGWNSVTTASWTPPSPEIFVRMVFNNPTSTYKELLVDLLRVSCTW